MSDYGEHNKRVTDLTKIIQKIEKHDKKHKEVREQELQLETTRMSLTKENQAIEEMKKSIGPKPTPKLKSKVD